MKTKNVKSEIMKTIFPFLEKLQARNEVIGIVLLGGLGKRNFMDEYSDIDLAVFTEKSNAFKFPLPFEFHYKKDRFLEFNIHQLIIEDEEKAKFWPQGKIEAYMNGVVYYDTKCRVKNLLENKLKFNHQEAFDRLVWIAQQYIWRGKIHSIRSYYRGYPETANDLLNNCTDILLEAVYLLNEQYLPHKKWELPFLERLPDNFELIEKFKKVKRISAFELQDIKYKIELLDEIYNIIMRAIYVKYKNFPLDPYKYYYRNFVQLNSTTQADLKYKELYNRDKILTEEDAELFGEICFNMDKFLS